MHNYPGRLISVSFEALPVLEPRLLVTRRASFFARWWKARKRRYFRLVEQWSVDIVCHKTTHRLNQLAGTIIVPGSQDYIYDGASVPFPWIVTLFTVGILRPMGIMLTASIVHDYAYRNGYLLFKAASGKTQQRQVARHDADLLFWKMISTVNGTTVWAFLAWSAVRLGWLGVKYDSRRWRGRPPIAHLVGVALLLVVATQACP